MAALNFYLFFIASQLKCEKSTVEKDLAIFRERNSPIASYFFGSGVSMADIFGKGEWVTRAPAKHHTTSGEEVLQMNDESQRFFNAFVVVQQFEAIELFLKRV